MFTLAVVIIAVKPSQVTTGSRRRKESVDRVTAAAEGDKKKKGGKGFFLNRGLIF